MKNTHIEWCDHTFNPWEGCTKVSPGCAHCYAETRNARFNGGEAPNWGKGAPRRRTSVDNWKQPLKWGREAADAMRRWHTCIAELFGGNEAAAIAQGYTKRQRPRVFCASLADWLDDEVPVAWLADLLVLIHATPNLDWLLLTKRPQNFASRIREARAWMIGHLYAQTERGQSIIHVNPNLAAGLSLIGKPVDQLRSEYARYADALEMVCAWTCSDFETRKDEPPANVWIGTTVEDQLRADERIPELLSIPARVRFLSCEPLLGPVHLLTAWKKGPGHVETLDHPKPFNPLHGIDWLICGGESGAGARPMHPGWARSLRDQCAAAGIAFFFKQWGEWIGFNAAARPDVRVLGVDIGGRVFKPDELYQFGDGYLAARIGKKANGRKLEGREYNEFPNATTSHGGAIG